MYLGPAGCAGGATTIAQPATNISISRHDWGDTRPLPETSPSTYACLAGNVEHLVGRAAPLDAYLVGNGSTH